VCGNWCRSTVLVVVAHTVVGSRWEGDRELIFAAFLFDGWCARS